MKLLAFEAATRLTCENQIICKFTESIIYTERLTFANTLRYLNSVPFNNIGYVSLEPQNLYVSLEPFCQFRTLCSSHKQVNNKFHFSVKNAIT